MIGIDIRKMLGDFSLDISFQSDAGTIGFLGASGEGKSVTLRCIAGIMKPDSGRIVYNGRVLYDSEQHIDLAPQKRRVGYLFQNYALFPNMTVEKNILCGMSGIRDRNEKKERLAAMIEKMHLTGLEKHRPFQLSGGQAQRTALARILVSEPELLLLDEPFSALDSYLKDSLQVELFETLKDYPGTVIMVSHSRDEIYRFSEEVVVLDKGRVDDMGSNTRIFERPATRQAAVLTGCKNFTRAERLDGHHARLIDWGVTVETKAEIPEDVRFMGYRAHDFIPVYGEILPGSVPVELQSEAELPFERNFYLKPKNWNAESGLITWFVQRSGYEELEKKGVPDALGLREDKMLFVR